MKYRHTQPRKGDNADESRKAAHRGSIGYDDGIWKWVDEWSDALAHYDHDDMAQAINQDEATVPGNV